METGPARQYGNADVGGHAIVHQGDAHTSTILNIFPGNTIHVSVREPIEQYPTASNRRVGDTKGYDQDLRTAQRKRFQTKDIQDGQSLLRRSRPKQPLEHRPRHETHSRAPAAQDQDLRNQGIHLVNQILQASGSKEHVSLSSVEEMDVHNAHALHHIHSTLNTLRETTQTKSRTLLTLIDCLRLNDLFPVIAKVFPNLLATSQEKAFREVAMLPSSADTIAPPKTYGSAQDLLCVFLAMLAMLSCNDTGHGHAKNGQGALIRSTPGKLSLIAGLVTFALACYLCMPAMLYQISEWAGGSLVIEDPFMHELRVPQAHVEHFTLLEAFLRLKLSDTTAEAFIEAGQFNLTIGQRHGRVISKNDWSVKGRVSSQQRVVMSVFLKLQDAKCVMCHAQLSMSDSGQFACHLCGKAYGNCASLKYFNEFTQRHSVQPNGRVPSSNRPHLSQDAVQTGDDEEPDDEYDLHGLQNIDFRILRRSRLQHTLDPQVSMPSNIDLKYDPIRSQIQPVAVDHDSAHFEATMFMTEPFTDVNHTRMLIPFYVVIDNIKWDETDIEFLEYRSNQSSRTSTHWVVKVYDLQPDQLYTCSFHLLDALTDHPTTEFGSVQITPSQVSSAYTGLYHASRSPKDQVDGSGSMTYDLAAQHSDATGSVGLDTNRVENISALPAIFGKPVETAPDVQWSRQPAPRGSVSSLQKEHSEKISHRTPRQKNMLAQGLAKANQAVLLDNAQDISGAIHAYVETCEILEQVLVRSSNDEDRKKLSAIRNKYSSRIADLYDINK